MNRKELYKDLNCWRATCRRQKRRYYSSRNYGDGKRHRWSDREIELLFTSEKSDTELAKELSRSVAAIQIKRSKLKHMDSYNCKGE